jgi:hypothetical protein
MSISRDLSTLKRKVKPREAKPVQTAVVGLLPGILGDALAAMSRAGKKLPKSVPGYGALPPGDVINIHHYTPQQGLEVLDPAKWGSRAGTARNMERSWVEGEPDIYPAQAYLPDFGYVNENKWGPTPERIEGAVPGMYNELEDPLGIRALVKEKLEGAREGGLYPVRSYELKQEFQREVQRRGFSGTYAPSGAAQGGTAFITDLVATGAPGTYPNIAQLRANLNLPNEVGKELFPVNDPVATVTTETMPGKALTPHRYRLYENDPAAAWLLHRDYERLLRNPDTSSVVAKYLDQDEAPVYQGQGYFQGQRNPVSGARVEQPGESLKRPMNRHERAKMDAVAVVEGVLRDQDAAAWARPRELSPVPGADTTAVLLKGKNMGSYQLKQVVEELEKIDAGQYRWGDNPENLTEHFPIVPNPDGSPGVMVFNANPNIPSDVFRGVIEGIIAKHETKWRNLGSTDFTPLWGKHDSGYIPSSDYAAVLSKLPTALKKNAERALKELSPAVNEIRAYHDRIRQAGTP